MSTSGTLTAAPAPAAAPAPGTTQVVPPPAAPGAAQVPGQTGSGPAHEGAAATWTDGFDEDMRGYIGNKGFKTPKDLADSYRNLEKLRGVPAEQLLTLPKIMRDENGVLTPEGRAVVERLGVPKDMKDYDIPMPEKGGDPKMAEVFRKQFFDLGVPADVAQKITKQWNEYVGNAQNEARAQAEVQFKAQDQNLRGEWGAAYDQNVNVAKEAMRTAGINAQQVDALSGALGHEATMKLLVNIGKSNAEGTFKSSTPGNNGPLEPATAMHQIRALSADPVFRQKLASGDAEANARWTRLHQQASPGEITQR